MDKVLQYEEYPRERIAGSRGQRGVFEYRLILELGKRGKPGGSPGEIVNAVRCSIAPSVSQNGKE